jgi:hypothetical protein
MARHKVKDLNLRGSSVLSDEEFLALGKMLVAFHGLEQFLLVFFHSESVQPDAGVLLTLGQCLKQLRKHILPRIKDARLNKEFDQLLNRANKINKTRNEIVHSAIGKTGDHLEMAKIRSTMKNGKMHSSVKALSINDILELAEGINGLRAAYHGLFLKAYCPHAFE